tara:strand:- start:693 stop:974 length:282 start_codon:yes stop_codon:yes gene_type:complete
MLLAEIELIATLDRFPRSLGIHLLGVVNKAELATALPPHDPAERVDHQPLNNGKTDRTGEQQKLAGLLVIHPLDAPCGHRGQDRHYQGTVEYE